MKRSAFTMIELIFVIVILGILASVAIPKLAGVQDDAYVSLEKSGIASVKSGALAVRSRALLRGTGQSFSVDVEFDNATTQTGSVAFDGNTTLTYAANTLSKTRYPYGLSVAAVDVNATAAFAAPAGSGLALAIVLGADGRGDWATNQDANTTRIVGPASLNVEAGSAEYDQAGTWVYDAGTGLIKYDAATAFVAP